MADGGASADIIKSSAAAFGDTFYVTAWIALAGVLISLILRKPRMKPGDELDELEGKPDVTMMMGH